MADEVINIKVCCPLRLRSGLTGSYHAIFHYSYNLPAWFSSGERADGEVLIFRTLMTLILLIIADRNQSKSFKSLLGFTDF